MSQPVKAGVVGLGPHGLRHIKACLEVRGVEVAAICDVRDDAVTKAKELAPSSRAFNDWQDMLRDEQLDLINIVTNGPSHAAITLAAAAAGVRYILCEKPMATSIADASAMIDACKANNVRLSIAHARRWVKSYQQLKELIATGLIGTPCHFASVLGGGLFAGNGTHTMDLARMLSGAEPVSVTAFVDPNPSANPRGEQFTDPGAFAVYWFDNGMRLVIDMYGDLGVAPPMDLIGSIGHVRIDEPANDWKINARQGEDRNEPVGKYWLPLAPIAFSSEPLNMIDMLAAGIEELIGDGLILCTGEDGKAALEMVIGAHISSRSGHRTIELPLSKNHYDVDIPLT